MVSEKSTLENYVLNETPQTAEVEYGKTTTLTFTNEKKKGQVKIVKVDADDNSIPIEGVKFEIRNSKGQVVDELITDSRGEAVSIRLPIDENYVLVEVETLDNYVLDDTPIDIVVENNVLSLLSLTNEMVKGYIKIEKQSEEDNKYSNLKAGSGLSGAVFEIYDTNENLVDTVTTGVDGTCITKELLKGKYIILEKFAPHYYILKENNVYFAEITTNGQVSEIKITNKNVELDVNIDKVGFKETQSKDNVYYEFDNISNNSNVALDNFVWEDTLPTSAVRVNKLYTGTWSEDLKYSVWYKTNKNDEYKLLVKDLSTQKNNEIDFSKLKLSKDEYVISYKLMFGTVKPGFSQIEKPILYCDMLDNLGNGFVFTNNTKVYGNYLEAYVEDSDNWTTITYYKTIQLEKLPKTGC